MTETKSYFLYIETPVGAMKISGTETGISAAEFRETTEATSTEVPQILHTCAAQLQEYYTGKRMQFDLPLQQSGTEFQQRVWNELTKIPFGKTISYLELARRLGDEKVIRAAGTANGKNNLAVIVPCHRVIGSDGSLTGYAGGLHRKEWLLRHEGIWPIGGQTELF
jgi:methylated-DNA-[protein]-cysteine S-methyltransferase